MFGPIFVCGSAVSLNPSLKLDGFSVVVNYIPEVQLNLYVVDYDEEYRSGSMLIAANDVDQAEELMKQTIRPGEWSITGPTLVPGKITGVQPSVLHDYRYIE